MSTTQQSSLRRYETDGWGLIESTPDPSRRRVLMLPGLFCTSEFYVDVLEDEALAGAGVAALAGDPPGFAGRPAPDGFDFSIESYAALVEDFAARQSIDLVVGHSYTANVGIEMAARGRFAGKLLLLSPSLSREDEEDDLRSLDQASRTPVVGTLVWLGINPTLKRGMKGRLPSARFEELFGEMKRNPRSVNRRLVTGFFDHLAEHGGLAERLAASRSTVWLGRGDRDEIGMTDGERAILEAAPHVRLKTISGAAHFSITDTPDAVVRLVLDLLADDAS